MAETMMMESKKEGSWAKSRALLADSIRRGTGLSEYRNLNLVGMRLASYTMGERKKPRSRLSAPPTGRWLRGSSGSRPRKREKLSTEARLRPWPQPRNSTES